jgi:rhamnogalacturonan endolyase
VTDPLAPKLTVSRLRVGLASPPYSADAGGRNAPRVDWQRDSKHYQFWVEADADGRFTIPNVRPGSYTLYAFADGVLGEFSHPDVTVAAGQKLDLGQLNWTPVRRGRQLWEIGVPDRTAGEFRHGDNYWHWGLYYDYTKEFPSDVNFLIGQSDWRKDWNYCQPPRIDGNRVTPTTWSITFDLPEAPRPGAKATLRLAFAGSRGRGGVELTANDHPAGNTAPLPDTGVMHRDGIRGYWFEREVPFDATLLQKGRNVIKLRVPATSWVDGVLYDYLRLELDDGETSSGQRPKK